MAENIKRTVGHNIRRLRDKWDWSQEKLAEMADLDRPYVGRIERGARRGGVPLTVRPFPGIILPWYGLWRFPSDGTEVVAG